MRLLIHYTLDGLQPGPKTKKFELAFAQYVNAKHAIAVNSGTAALHLALEAIGVGPGDEVIIPTMTFAATGEVVRYLNANPILVDIKSTDHCIDLEAVKKAITIKTKAIIPVHFAGQACDMDELLAIAKSRGLYIIEDAAHAFPTKYKDTIVGGIGDITCFSFYATKTISTGEGGMITTNSDQWADRMRVMSLHGISKDAWKRYSSEGNWYYEIIAPGYKYNITDIASAIGYVQLKRSDELLEKRRIIAKYYNEAFVACSDITLLHVNDFEHHSWHLYIIKLNLEHLTISRAEFIEKLKQHGIIASVHFIPLHLHPYYKETFGYQKEKFPVALDCYKKSISLPIYSRMSSDDKNIVAEKVLMLIESNKK